MIHMRTHARISTDLSQSSQNLSRGPERARPSAWRSPAADLGQARTAVASSNSHMSRPTLDKSDHALGRPTRGLEAPRSTASLTTKVKMTENEKIFVPLTAVYSHSQVFP